MIFISTIQTISTRYFFKRLTSSSQVSFNTQVNNHLKVKIEWKNNLHQFSVIKCFGRNLYQRSVDNIIIPSTKISI